MPRLIVWNMISLDGYIDSATPWELPWHEPMWSDDLEALSLEQLTSAGGLLFGRLTYEGMRDYWKKETGAIADLMNSVPKFVASDTLSHDAWAREFLPRATLPKRIRELKNTLAGDLYVFGSGHLLETLIREDLVDEYRLGIAPYLHGSGKHHFAPGAGPRALRLKEARPVKNGGVILFYESQ